MEMKIGQSYSVTCIAEVKVACYSVEEKAEVQAIILALHWRGTMWQFDVIVCGYIWT